MIVNKNTKEIQTRSDMININWMGDEWFLVKDDSELAHKILDLYPYFDFVIDGDQLIDIIEIAKTNEELKQEQIMLIKQELSILDKTINRATEDLYIATNTSPYTSIQEVIDKKNELRKELRNLNN